VRYIANACALFAVTVAVTGCVTDVVAPAPSAASAPSPPTLGGTLEIVRSQLAQQGQIAYSIAVNDTAQNRSWVNQFTVEASRVTSDPDNCRVSFHWHTTIDGKVVADLDSGLPLKEAADITLISMDEDMILSAAKGGHGGWVMKTVPQIWVVHLTRRDGSQNTVDFRDRAAAQTVVNAMRQAATLCP
jgi:hypothetical protein